MVARDLPTPELIRRFEELSGRIGKLQAHRDSYAARRGRSAEIGIGAVIAVGGLALAPPTGGLSLIFAAGGFWLSVRALEADNAITNEDRRASVELAKLEAAYVEIAAELKRRKLLP